MRALIAAPLLLLAAPAAAQVPFNPAAPENRQVMPTFNYDTVEVVLRQINARFERRGTAERPALQVSFRTAGGRRSCSAAASGRARPARRSASRRSGRARPPCRRSG